MKEIIEKVKQGLYRHNCEDLVLLCGVDKLHEPSQLFGTLITIFRYLRDLQEGPVLSKPLERLEKALIPKIVYLVENFDDLDQAARNNLLDDLQFTCRELAPDIQAHWD